MSAIVTIATKDSSVLLEERSTQVFREQINRYVFWFTPINVNW
jgi:hypothetical protein